MNREALGAALHSATLVVVDVESTGLDPGSDALVAIGAVRLEAARIALGDPFYVVLRQPAPSSDENILVHGIARDEQAAGVHPRDALEAFRDFCRGAPLLAWHASFDALLIERAAKRGAFRPAWIDVAALAHALVPARRSDSLDEWCAAFGIANARRHHGLADALATAQLFLALQPAALQQGLRTVGDLAKAAKAQA